LIGQNPRAEEKKMQMESLLQESSSEQHVEALTESISQQMPETDDDSVLDAEHLTPSQFRDFGQNITGLAVPER
jgi:hypothetical protein